MNLPPLLKPNRLIVLCTPSAAREQVAALTAELHPFIRSEHIHFYREEGLDAAIAKVNMLDAADRPIAEYSKGMRQRAKVAAALVNDPELLVLDEPLNGADPRQRVHFQELLHRLAGDGRTIVISSHILEEVEQLADTVLLVINGKLAASGGFRAIRAALDERPYHVRVLSDAPRRLAAAVVGLDAVEAVSVDPDGAVVVLSVLSRILILDYPEGILQLLVAMPWPFN